MAGTVGCRCRASRCVVDRPETGDVLAQGEIGMIEIRGPNVFKGYWRMPEKTAAEFRADGFFITGDLGLIDERRLVSIVGRGKDLIISGGFNIYPKEVETRSTPCPAWSNARSSACRIPISARESRRSLCRQGR